MKQPLEPTDDSKLVGDFYDMPDGRRAFIEDRDKQALLDALLQERGMRREYGVRERVGNRIARYRDLYAALEETRRTGARMPIPIYVPHGPTDAS